MPGVGLRGERSPSGSARQHGRQSGDAVRDGVRAVTEEAGRQRALLLRHGPPVRPGTRLTLATSRAVSHPALPPCPPGRCSAKATLWPRRHCPAFLSPKWSRSGYLNSAEKELQNTSSCKHENIYFFSTKEIVTIPFKIHYFGRGKFNGPTFPNPMAEKNAASL